MITEQKKNLQPKKLGSDVRRLSDDHPNGISLFELTMSVFHGKYPEPFVVSWLIFVSYTLIVSLPKSSHVDGRLGGWILGSNMSNSKTRGIIRLMVQNSG